MLMCELFRMDEHLFTICARIDRFLLSSSKFCLMLVRVLLELPTWCAHLSSVSQHTQLISIVLLISQELKLPVQYLTDNPASTPETCALLISGPTSFRHRYDFVKAAGSCVSFMMDQELIYIQSHLAIDSRSSAKVLMRFHSSIRAVEHEREMLLHLITVVSTSNLHMHMGCKNADAVFDAA